MTAGARHHEIYRHIGRHSCSHRARNTTAAGIDYVDRTVPGHVEDYVGETALVVRIALRQLDAHREMVVGSHGGYDVAGLHVLSLTHGERPVTTPAMGLVARDVAAAGLYDAWAAR